MRSKREKTMYRNRMVQALRVLEAVRDEQRLFSLHTWRSVDPEFFEELISSEALPDGACGTVACAIGHIMVDPWFTRRGFKGEWYNKLEAEPVFTLRNEEHRYRGWRAVQKFFDISAVHSDHLFDANDYEDGNPTIDQVIERMREFIPFRYGASEEVSV